MSCDVLHPKLEAFKKPNEQPGTEWKDALSGSCVIPAGATDGWAEGWDMSSIDCHICHYCPGQHGSGDRCHIGCSAFDPDCARDVTAAASRQQDLIRSQSNRIWMIFSLSNITCKYSSIIIGFWGLDSLSKILGTDHSISCKVYKRTEI